MAKRRHHSEIGKVGRCETAPEIVKPDRLEQSICRAMFRHVTKVWRERVARRCANGVCVFLDECFQAYPPFFNYYVINSEQLL